MFNEVSLTYVISVGGFALAAIASVIGIFISHSKFSAKMQEYKAFLARKQRMTELGVSDYQEEAADGNPIASPKKPVASYVVLTLALIVSLVMIGFLVYEYLPF